MKTQTALIKSYLKEEAFDIKPGDTIKVYQKIPIAADKKVKGDKERHKTKIQVFEGVVLARKHGKGINSTITVRKIIDGCGVERTFPLHSPSIEKIENVFRTKTKRAKLYYLRKLTGKKAKLRKDIKKK